MTQARLDRNLRETLTLWARPSGDPDQRGRVTFVAPVSIKGRWEQRAERFLTLDGEEEVSRAVVFVDRAVAVGSRLLRGVSTVTDPLPVDGTFPVRAFLSVPHLLNADVVERRCLV